MLIIPTQLTLKIVINFEPVTGSIFAFWILVWAYADYVDWSLDLFIGDSIVTVASKLKTKNLETDDHSYINLG